MSDLRDLTRALKDISGAAKAAGKAGQAIGKATGDITGADDQYRKTDADHEDRANRAEIRRNRSAASLRGEADGEHGPSGGRGARGARGERAAEASSSDTLVGAVAEVMRMAPNSPERAEAIRNIAEYIEANPRLHKQTYNHASGSRNHTYELPQIGDAPQHADDVRQPKVRPIKGVASAEQLIEAISQKLAGQVGAPAISRSELGLPSDRAAQPVQSPASPTAAPAADEAKTPQYFVAQAAHALANGAEAKNIPLEGLSKKDGLYHLPAGSYSTGRSDAKGNQITLEIPKEGLTLSLEEMQKAMAAKLAEVGVGQPQKTAAPAEPAPAEPAKPTHVVHKPADAPAAKPAEKGFTPMAIPPADLKALMAKSYSGLTPKQMPDGLRQTQVTEVQNMLKAAGFDLGKHGADGKCGKDTVEALKAACKAAGIDDYKKVNFANPTDPELVKLQAHLNNVAKEAAQAKDAQQAAPAAAPVQEAAAPAPAVAAAPAPATEPAPAAAAPALAPAATEPQPAMVAAAFANAANAPAFAAMPAMAAAGRESLFGAAPFGATEALPTPDALKQVVALARSAIMEQAPANEAVFRPDRLPDARTDEQKAVRAGGVNI